MNFFVDDDCIVLNYIPVQLRLWSSSPTISLMSVRRT
jgi:hypothetical protein